MAPHRPLLPPPSSRLLSAALPADDRGGFKSVRQLMEPVIGEMQEAAAGGEDDGLLMRAVRGVGASEHAVLCDCLLPKGVGGRLALCRGPTLTLLTPPPLPLLRCRSAVALQAL